MSTAREPTDILWKNQVYNPSFKRSVCIIISSILTICFCFFGLLGLQSSVNYVDPQTKTYL